MKFPETLRQFSNETVECFLKNGLVLDTHRGLIVGWGQNQSHDQAQSNEFSFFLPDFSLTDSCPWKTFSQVAILNQTGREALVAALEAHLNLYEPNPRGTERSWIEAKETDFDDLFQKIQMQFRTTSLKKLVPLVPWISKAKMEDWEKGQRILRVLRQKSAGSIYGFWEGDSGILGDSPESLFSLDQGGKLLRTMAVAGTLEGSKSGALLGNPKLMDEHNWVIKDILERVKPLGNASLSETKEVPWRTLVHLRTEISVQCERSIEFSDLVARIHPTPALGAYPRIAIAEIVKWDFIPRFRYGAPFGYLDSNGDGECLVAIRNVQWNDKGIVLFTGCGLIETSESHLEWEEHQNKCRAVKENLGFL